MDVRLEIPSKAPPIRAVLEAAFPTATEAELVDELRRAGDGALLVGGGRWRENRRLRRIFRNGRAIPALALGPVAVRPERQRRGVGSLLIRHGLARCEVGGWAAVFVLGNPAYYGRFGFRADRASGFESPYVGPHFMALALGRGELPANYAFAALG